ncbi:sensor histidine kinase [Actinoplanes sp. NPDC049265]|uniref:sensor histidine kinase n=1 Tax=Actinoplanes sp. NPDC049265 TaxID=3363902 RepID=UPI003719DB71
MLTSAAEFALRGWWLTGLSRRLTLLVFDFAVLIGVLALSGGGAAFFGYAATFSALAGILLGVRAVPLWLGVGTQAWAVGVAAGASFVMPPAIATAGVAAAAMRHVLIRRRVRATAEVEAALQSAAALERARLARELHDSVAKTVRGMSLAALALPRSLNHQPQVAAQLADAISSAAEAAERETRALLSGLRLDSAAADFADTVDRLCAVWSAETGVPVDVEVPRVEPSVAVRYELVRILHEALTNVARHARAGRVLVLVRRQEQGLSLVVRDDGVGFHVPEDLSLSTMGDHHGLIGMTERARTVGGSLDVASTPGRGTIVTVRVPT